MSEELRAKRGEVRFVTGSRRHPKFEVAIWHPGSDRYQVLQAHDPFALEGMAIRLMAQWDEEWDRHQESAMDPSSTTSGAKPERPTAHGMPRRRFHRGVFLAAGLYNLAWGAYSALDPQWLFRFAGMAPLNHPAIFACLAMVIGLYGVLYLEVARAPERGFLLAAVGLAGKVLGPIGLVVLIAQGTWPPASAVLCLTNDLVWWVPFALYLRDAWRFFRAAEPPFPTRLAS